MVESVRRADTAGLRRTHSESDSAVADTNLRSKVGEMRTAGPKCQPFYSGSPMRWKTDRQRVLLGKQRANLIFQLRVRAHLTMPLNPYAQCKRAPAYRPFSPTQTHVLR